MFITRFLLELANSYRANLSYAGVNARKLLDEELAIYVLPCVNPDGYEMTQFSGSIKSNLPAKSNANLVDLNRNFPNYSSAALHSVLRGKNSWRPARNPSCNEICSKIPYSRNKAFHRPPFGRKYRIRGKPHHSDSFNILCSKFRDVFIKNSKYKIAVDETTRHYSDGTVTDFVSEYINNFTFNATLGRLIPTGGVSNLMIKSNPREYRRLQ